jgi:serine/threonine protein kinase
MHPSTEALLEQWSEAHEQGHDLSDANLCQQRQEHIPDLQQAIREYRQVNILVRRIEALIPTMNVPNPTLTPCPEATPTSTRLPTSFDRHTDGTRTPGFHVLKVLGRGGMAIVYLARDLVTDRLIALKMLQPTFRRDPEARALFQREAQIVTQFAHRGIVQVYDAGMVHAPEGDLLPYLSLEYCDGGTLHERIAGKPLPLALALTIVESLARTMQAVHEAGIVHRDLKPGNVLLSFRRSSQASASVSDERLNDAIPQITDFGLAKRLDADDSQHSGMVLGTPSYMAPEQAEGRTSDVGPLVDVWALGAILYECVTGRPAFLGTNVLETLHLVCHIDALSPREVNPACPRDVETIIQKCLRREPSRRYASAQELADDLRRYRIGKPIHARPVGPMERMFKWVRRTLARCAV